MSKPYPGGALEIEFDVESDLTVLWNDLARMREDLDDLSDDSLLGLVRGGSADAYAVLFERYRRPALRLAGYYSNSIDAKDIVAESFAQVYDLLRRGKGPQTSFRAYLFTSIRHEAGRRAKMRKRDISTDDVETVDKPVLFGNGSIDRFERELVRDAFASLPQRWQTVLWHVDVEGRKPGEVAPMMGLKPNTVSALAYRARAGLRKAYLEQHVTTTDPSLPVVCRDVRSGLVDFVRGSATESDVTVIRAHLDVCAACNGAHLELDELNTHLGAASSAVVLSLAAPASAGLVGSLAAKWALLAKAIAATAGSTAATVGSTAAVIVTSMTFLDIPLESPAGAETVYVQPIASANQSEPDRSIGPAADQTVEKQSSTTTSSSTSATSAATDDTDAGQGQVQGRTTEPATTQEPSSGQTPPVSIKVDATKVSATVSAAGVKASVSVDLRKPEATRITLKSDKSGSGGIDTDKVTGKVKKLVDDVSKH